MHVVREYKFVGGPSRKRRRNRPRSQSRLSSCGQSPLAKGKAKRPNPAAEGPPEAPEAERITRIRREALPEPQLELPSPVLASQSLGCFQVYAPSADRTPIPTPSDPPSSSFFTPSHITFNPVTLGPSCGGKRPVTRVSSGVAPLSKEHRVPWFSPETGDFDDWTDGDHAGPSPVSYSSLDHLNTHHEESSAVVWEGPVYTDQNDGLPAEAPEALLSSTRREPVESACYQELSIFSRPASVAPLPNTGEEPGQYVFSDHRFFLQPSALHDTISRMFTRYDQEFCLLPVTHDCSSNPFRYDYQRVRDYSLLRHSVLALSYRHVNFDTGSCGREAAVYRRQAMQMLKQNMVTNRMPAVSLLDASTVLFTLDYAISAFGPWSLHIERVRVIIQNTPYADLTLQRRAQVALFVYFDVTLALTGRNGTILPQSLADDLIADDRDLDARYGSNKLDFFSVTGCPLDLFQFMVRLANYAWEMRMVSKMSCAKFDLAPVLRLRQAISSWTSSTYADPEAIGLDECLEVNENEDPSGAEERLNRQLDWYHCAESLRYVLLVYIERVFVWQARRESNASHTNVEEFGTLPPEKTANTEIGTSLGRIRFLARRSLNHVKSIRATTFVQKQLILPVFLAAAEIREDGLRHDAVNFCSWWRARNRYNLFLTTQALLEEIWQLSNGGDTWWGEVLDRKSHHDGREYLFG